MDRDLDTFLHRVSCDNNDRAGGAPPWACPAGSADDYHIGSDLEFDLCHSAVDHCGQTYLHFDGLIIQTIMQFYGGSRAHLGMNEYKKRLKILPLSEGIDPHVNGNVSPAREEIYALYAEEESVEIWVNTMTCRRVPIKLCLSMSGAHIKLIIQDREGIPPSQQRLLIQPSGPCSSPPWLLNSDTIGGKGFTLDNLPTIYLVLRLSGG